ncbi:pseudouridine synthase [Haliovirga abyssi]|uniref:Pseudouridine synthase n=1 Tax=Haliovirga abyssi TaxID=2996794 RepID=A0AAU9DJD2_9FUSO|nr:pseudouridine synthase [Haliovirga abyssi]BDU50924.1 pseudouridine synthase [Haliovirga abyssi]
MEKIRINKYLSSIGVDARRKIDELIKNKKVRINGKIAELGDRVNPKEDKIEVNGKIVKEEKKDLVCYMLNKPAKVLSAAKDDRGRKVVVNLIDDKQKLFPIGRLDYETEGLILITNNGEIFNKVIHPREKVYKTYIARVKGEIKNKDISLLTNGVYLDDGKTLPAKVELLSIKKNISEVKISIREGKNRQVRRMFDKIGHKVLHLKRVAIGELKIKNLKIGEYRKLSKKEIGKIMGE